MDGLGAPDPTKQFGNFTSLLQCALRRSFVKFRTNISPRLSDQQGFNDGNVFLPNGDMQRRFTHVTHCVDVSACFYECLHSMEIIAPNHDMKRCVAVAIHAVDLDRSLPKFGGK